MLLLFVGKNVTMIIRSMDNVGRLTSSQDDSERGFFLDMRGVVCGVRCRECFMQSRVR